MKKNTSDFEFKRIKFRGWDNIDEQYVAIILLNLVASIAFYGAGFYLGSSSPAYYFTCIPAAVVLTGIAIYLFMENFFRIEYYWSQEVYEREKRRKKK